MTKRNSKPAFVVFGKKGPRLPHAAWFDLSDALVARWVAQQHRLSLVQVDADVMRKALASLLPWGLTKDGQPMIPAVDHDTLDLLLQLKAEAAAIGEGSTTEDTATETTANGEPPSEAA